MKADRKIPRTPARQMIDLYTWSTPNGRKVSIAARSAARKAKSIESPDASQLVSDNSVDCTRDVKVGARQRHATEWGPVDRDHQIRHQTREIAMLKRTIVALAGALGLVLLAGPAGAQNYDSIMLRVPVQLKSMLAATVSVTCRIFRGTDELGAQWGGAHKIVNGEFNQVVEVEVKALGGQSFLGADGYSCELKVTSVEGGQGFTPYQGNPADNKTQLKWLARPDAFFRVKTEHTLDGLKFGVGGPKDLKSQKQP